MQASYLNKKIKTKILLLFSKSLLFAALLIYFLPLLILPFYNHPFADDYFCGYNLNNKGFIPYQIFIYKNWGGRFAATFVGSLFACHNFLYEHYYIHSLLLLIINFGSIFFLINCFNKYILKSNYGFLKKALITSLFLALEICSLSQVSTFIFWFSSAITYCLPVALIQIEIALFIFLFNTDKSLLKIACIMLLPSLVFITVGFNELFIMVHLFLLVIILWFKEYKKNFVVFILCAIAFLGGSALLLFAPGNKIRLHEISSKSTLTGLTAIAYHATEVMWNIFKNPFFWFGAMIVFMCANHKKEKWEYNTFIQKFVIKKWRFMFLIILFLAACVALPVTELKGGIIPERYINAVICFMIILLLFYFFILGISLQSKILTVFSQTQKAVVYFLLTLGLLCNNYIVDTYKNIIIAPVYNAILNEREAALKSTIIGNKTATVKSYNAALSNFIQTKYSASSVTYRQLIQQKPLFLFFEDDLATESSILILKNYYKLDSIRVQEY